jgi:hypothetical protein
MINLGRRASATVAFICAGSGSLRRSESVVRPNLGK